jgi:hypothetical protein
MTITHLPVERPPPLVVLNKGSNGGQDLWYPNIPGGKSPIQVRPSVGDSLTNDNSSPDVPRGRLEASISGSGQILFQSTTRVVPMGSSTRTVVDGSPTTDLTWPAENSSEKRAPHFLLISCNGASMIVYHDIWSTLTCWLDTLPRGLLRYEIVFVVVYSTTSRSRAVSLCPKNEKATPRPEPFQSYWSTLRRSQVKSSSRATHSRKWRALPTISSKCPWVSQSHQVVVKLQYTYRDTLDRQVQSDYGRPRGPPQ